MKKIEQKKAAVDLTELAVGIIVLGIVVAVGSTVLLGMRDSRLTSLSTYNTFNESTTSMNETGSLLANGYYSGLTTGSSITNESGGPVQTTDYTITVAANGRATIAYTSTAENESVNNTVWQVTYDSYNQSDTQYKVPNDAALGLAEYGNWFKILVIVGISAVILAIIFMAFGNSGGGRGSGGSVSF